MIAHGQNMPCLFIIIPWWSGGGVRGCRRVHQPLARLDPRCVADHDDVAQKRKKRNETLKCRHLKFRTQRRWKNGTSEQHKHTSRGLFSSTLLPSTFYDLFNRLREYVEHLLYSTCSVCVCVYFRASFYDLNTSLLSPSPFSLLLLLLHFARGVCSL